MNGTSNKDALFSDQLTLSSEADLKRGARVVLRRRGAWNFLVLDEKVDRVGGDHYLDI